MNKMGTNDNRAINLLKLSDDCLCQICSYIIAGSALYLIELDKSFLLTYRRMLRLQTPPLSDRLLCIAAAGEGLEPILKLLMAENLSFQNDQEFIKSVMLAAAEGGHLNILEGLIVQNSNIYEDCEFIKNLASAAAIQRHLHVLECLLAQNPNVTYSTELIKVLVSLAAEREFLPMLVNTLAYL
mmetsp:Transcript_5571/g.5757  ORF Transcript_5571/g.5757 Transcript_5571/m.5757 type:complete len:184 (+) Transcript_5571:120-671(+)